MGLKTLPEMKLGVWLQRWILLKGWKKLQGLSPIAKGGMVQMKGGGDFRGAQTVKRVRESVLRSVVSFVSSSFHFLI